MGFKRSHALWDKVRRAEPGTSDQLASWARAILYELQPFRCSQIDWTAWYASARSSYHACREFVTSTLPQVVRRFVPQLMQLAVRHWRPLAGILAYYLFIRWIHEILEAGPFVLMLTALVAIFTIGLGDTAGNGYSAYSVFNRGFERLLGSIDADQLLAQHVGGGMAMMGPPPPVFPEDEPPRRNHRRQQRQPLEQDEQPATLDALANNNNNNPDDDDDDPDDTNRARKSGKKARRRNQEHRLEMRRQRQAAQAMGFGGNEVEQVVAMQRLMDDQVANYHDGPGDE